MTKWKPATDLGDFFAALCCTIELAVGGAIIGMIGSHPKMFSLVVHLEGQEEEEEKKEPTPQKDLGIQESIAHRSVGFLRTVYFIPVLDGHQVWPKIRLVGLSSGPGRARAHARDWGPRPGPSVHDIEASY